MQPLGKGSWPHRPRRVVGRQRRTTKKSCQDRDLQTKCRNSQGDVRRGANINTEARILANDSWFRSAGEDSGLGKAWRVSGQRSSNRSQRAILERICQTVQNRVGHPEGMKNSDPQDMLGNTLEVNKVEAKPSILHHLGEASDQVTDGVGQSMKERVGVRITPS